VVAPGSSVSLEAAAPGDRTEAALDGGLLAPASRLVAPTVGDHWLAVGSRDAVGNLSAVRWIRLRVDAEPPKLSLEVMPAPVADAEGRSWVPEGARVSGRAVDDVAGLARLSIESGGRRSQGDGASPLVLSLGNDGQARARALDRVGNESEEVRLVLRVDAEPPSGRIRVEGPQAQAATALVVGPGARLRLDREDEGSGVAGWTGFMDGREVGSEEWPGPWPEGPHEAGAEIVDRVGHRTRPASLSFEVDATAPAIAWAVENEGAPGADGQTFFRPPVSVRVGAQDASAGVGALAWSAPGRDWEGLTEKLTTTAESVRIRARDRVGNEAETTATWRLDTEAPRILVDGEEVPAAHAVLERTVAEGFRITARDEGAGVARVTLSLDGAPWAAAPDLLRFLQPGLHRLTVRAVDRLGNARQVEWAGRIVKGPR
jgi:hypothetical protein